MAIKSTCIARVDGETLNDVWLNLPQDLGMEITETPLPGLLIFTPRRFGDDRGFFSEIYNPDKLKEYGIEVVLDRDNHSISSQPGTVRGLHFQGPPFPQVKIVRCASGSLFDVVVDIRKGSPTFGHWFGAELSAQNGRQLFVPIGFAHGFVTLSPDTEVQYKLSAGYAPECEGAIRWDDPDLGIDWPLANNEPTISAKDAVAPLFAEFETPFIWEDDIPAVDFEQAKRRRSRRQRIEQVLTETPNEAGQFVDAVIELLDERIALLGSRKPNDKAQLINWEENNDYLAEVRSLLVELTQKVKNVENASPTELTEETESLLLVYQRKISEWPRNNVDEVTDGLMRVGLVGVCAGVGLTFGMPVLAAGVGAAMFGGEKIGKAIASALKGGG